MSSLQLRDLTVERGGRAVVRDVSVEIAAGQVTALLGPNGAGKSTLVLAVGGVLKPKAGSVSMPVNSIASSTSRRRAAAPSLACSCTMATLSNTDSSSMLEAKNPKTSPAAARRPSARPASRSSPKAAACCPT